MVDKISLLNDIDTQKLASLAFGRFSLLDVSRFSVICISVKCFFYFSEWKMNSGIADPELRKVRTIVLTELTTVTYFQRTARNSVTFKIIILSFESRPIPQSSCKSHVIT